ncbi:MAG: transglycosylase domain-containing protein, partial [Deltaproteobacteria bacterium]|nr:transglycosylase domain-containing protein [Deltaproteobacteria bacterium]
RAPGTDGEVTNRIEAQVNLVTGDVTGTLELPGFPLHPYRFLAPRAVVLTPASRLVDTRLRFMWEKEKSLLRVWGAAHLNGVTVSSARLASEPLRDLDVTVELGSSPEQGLSMDLKAHVLDTGESCRTRLGRGPAVRTRLRLEGADGEYPRFLLSLVMDLTPLQQVLDSIPRPLIQQVAGMQVQGYVAAELQLSGDSGDLGNLAFDFRFTERDVSVDAWGGEVDLQKLLAPFTFRIRGGGKERKTIRVGEGPLWTPLEEVPPWVVLAVTTTEDGSFFRHDGFNRFQWKMTVIDNLEAGRFVRGASTISMQLVKNLFLGHEKTVARKLQELILTWLMEKAVPKERIIELYLNIIEWGRGVYGLAGAARHYFDRSSRELTLAQAALLATFIPHPRPFDDRFSAGRDPGARTRSWDKWWEQRLRLVKRVVRAMVNNCDKVDSKCPSSTGATCQALQRMCSSNRSVFWEAENLTSLDKVFEPAPPSDDTAVDGPDAGTAVEL